MEQKSRKLLTEAEIEAALPALPSWRRAGKALVRTQKFADFAAAVAFVNRLVEPADAMDHHPDILIQYNRVSLTLATHSAGGLTALDFELAQRIDRL